MSWNWEVAKTIFDWTAVLLAGATFIVGAGALISGNILNKRQAEKLRQFDLDLTGAKTKLVESERKLLEERQHSANRDIPISEQHRLSKELMAFKRQRARIEVFPVDFETRTAAMSLQGILLNANWDAEPPKMLCCPPNLMTQGLYITSTADKASAEAAAALARLLADTPFAANLIPFQGSPAIPSQPKYPHVYILVGDKPTALRSWVK